MPFYALSERQVVFIKTELSRKAFLKGSMLVVAGATFTGALSGFEKIASAEAAIAKMPKRMPRSHDR